MPAARRAAIQFIIDTSADLDHTGGNAKIAQAGATFGGGPGLGAFGFVKESAMVYAHENVLARMTSAKTPTAGMPTETYITDLKQFFNGEGIQLIHQTAAHSDGDTLLHFRGSDVISAGDVLSTTTYPVFDIARGGSINGIIDGLNHLLDLVIAEYHGRRHTGDPRTRTGVRCGRHRHLSRHGHDHSRSRSGHDQERHDTGTGQGFQAHQGL
jgi:cyclase